MAADKDFAKAVRRSRPQVEYVPLHFTDLVVKVRRINYPWPFPVSVDPKVGIVRNQTVTSTKLSPARLESFGTAKF